MEIVLRTQQYFLKLPIGMKLGVSAKLDETGRKRSTEITCHNACMHDFSNTAPSTQYGKLYQVV